MKLPQLLRSIAASSAALFGGSYEITIPVPTLISQPEVDSFVKEHGRVLLAYTARRCSDPRAYDPWQAAVCKLFTEMYQDPNNLSDRPKLAVAEVVQSGTGKEESETKQLSFNGGDTVMSLSFSGQQISGVTHVGSGWVRIEQDQVMLKPAFGVPCPELPNSLVLQFQDNSDSEDNSQRRQKKMFFAPYAQNNSVSEIIEFCESEYFRSDALVNFTQGLPITATRNQTLGLIGCHPSVSNVGALHIQVNETTWSKSIEVTLERISSHQKESDIGVLVERIPDGSLSTILQYERKSEEDQVAFPLESPQQIEELYNAIVQREKDGVFDDEDDPQE
jgi:hypothetical protein